MNVSHTIIDPHSHGKPEKVKFDFLKLCNFFGELSERLIFRKIEFEIVVRNTILYDKLVLGVTNEVELMKARMRAKLERVRAASF
jgi:hypothetical protein